MTSSAHQEYFRSVLKQLEREKTWVIGLLQALLVALYCASVAATFNLFTRLFPKDPPGLSGFFLLMLLFVFSAAVTGSLVFGFPAYLVVVKRKIKEAAQILAYTLFFSLIIILATIIFLLSVLV